MKITIEINEVIAKDFENDKFEECFDRVLADVVLHDRCCGLYEQEILEELKRAFKEAEYAKLADYEDIDEDFGIDLPTVVRALKGDIWVKTEKGVIPFKDFDVVGYPSIFYSHLYNEWYIGSDNCDWEHYEEHFYKLKDYGKTWALTEEELKGEK